MKAISWKNMKKHEKFDFFMFFHVFSCFFMKLPSFGLTFSTVFAKYDFDDFFYENYDFSWISMKSHHFWLRFTLFWNDVDFDENFGKRLKKMKKGANIVENVSPNEGFETLESRKNFEENEKNSSKTYGFWKETRN